MTGRGITAVALAVVTLGPVASCASEASSYLSAWEDEEGRRAPAAQIETYAGEEHCGWESAGFLHVVWPPGTGGQPRQYVRDPESVVVPVLGAALATDVPVPENAVPTGFTNDAGMSLWLSPDDEDADEDVAYLVDEDGTAERWPRAEPPTGCD